MLIRILDKNHTGLFLYYDVTFAIFRYDRIPALTAKTVWFYHIIPYFNFLLSGILTRTLDGSFEVTRP